MLRETTEDERAIAIRRQRTQDRRELEPGALTAWRPVVDACEVSRDAVRKIDEAEPLDGIRRRLCQSRQRRDHGVEQRQPQARTHTAEKRSSRKRSLGYEHSDPCLEPRALPPSSS